MDVHAFSHGHGYSHYYHPSWHHVLPYYDRHYYGTYYYDDGRNYYLPRTYSGTSGSYLAAKPIPIEFGGYAHIDDLSGRLEKLANELCLDLHYNYPHNPVFAEVYRDAYRVYDTAKYIHHKEHQSDREELRRRLDEVDSDFHRVQAEVRGWSRRHVRQIGQGGAQTKLQLVESSLHHLMNDVGIKGSSHQSGLEAPPPSSGEIAPPPQPPSRP